MTGATLQFESGAVTHVGRVRSLNEDSLFVSEENGVWLVADGMGGHRDGKLASTMIADALRALPRATSAPELLTRVSEKLTQVSGELCHLGQADGGGVIGSTVAALLVFGGQFACVWAGDSRIYLARGGALRQLTRDHTEVQELVDGGMLTADEAKSWPRRNVITRAVGAAGDPRLEVLQGELRAGDIYILCSDGLTNHVDDEEILNLASRGPAQRAAEALVALALQRGGRDNVSVVVVAVRQQQAATVIVKPS
jgi:serine/threonine protein phosphatase PrpC